MNHMSYIEHIGKNILLGLSIFVCQTNLLNEQVCHMSLYDTLPDHIKFSYD